MTAMIGLVLLAIGFFYQIGAIILPLRVGGRPDPYAAHIGSQEKVVGVYVSPVERLVSLLPKEQVRKYRTKVDIGPKFQWGAFLDQQFAFILMFTGVALVVVPTFIFIVAAALIGGFVVYASARSKARQQEQKFLAQLPAALLLISSAMAAGRNFTNALEATNVNLADPIKTELGGLARQISGLRITEAQAFALWAERLPYPELMTASSALQIGNRVGVETEVMLRGLADSVQAQIRQRAELEAVTSQVRSTATVVSYLPFIFLLIIYLIAPNFVGPILKPVAGWALLAIVIAMNYGSRRISRRIMERVSV